jgi:hypothetical protein
MGTSAVRSLTCSSTAVNVPPSACPAKTHFAHFWPRSQLKLLRKNALVDFATPVRPSGRMLRQFDRPLTDFHYVGLKFVDVRRSCGPRGSLKQGDPEDVE